MVYNLISIFTICLILHVVCFSSSNPTVETDVGLIIGLPATDGDYNKYLGVPYAKVDEDDPFGPAQPYPKFDVFNAVDDSTVCPQNHPSMNFTERMTLDCLRLNIYVPHGASPATPLPVLVWIHGGGFTIGFASLHGPKFIVRHDVILITVSYRLGLYGFMCLDTPEVPGNQGLKDQLLALKWIKANIASFGGNADEITVAGTSAGSMSIDFHLLSSHERLFSKVIMQSGHAIRWHMFRDSNRQIPISVARELGSTTTNFEEAVAYLSEFSPQAVMDAVRRAGFGMGAFRPCVEKAFRGVEGFVTDFPINLKIPNVNGLKLLVGFTENESLMSYYFRTPESYADVDTFNQKLRDAFTFDEDKHVEVEYLVRRFYIGDAEISEDVKWELSDFDSDMEFAYPAERSIKRYLENGADEVFYYMFSYSGHRNLAQRRSNLLLGTAVHGDEYGYLFDMDSMPEVPTTEDQLMIDRMTTMWTNFVKYGHPTPQVSELLPVKWEPITNDTVYNYLDMGPELILGQRPFHSRFAFWELFVQAYAEYEHGFGRSSSGSILLNPVLIISLLFTVFRYNY